MDIFNEIFTDSSPDNVEILDNDQLFGIFSRTEDKSKSLSDVSNTECLDFLIHPYRKNIYEW